MLMDPKELPSHVRMSKGGLACAHCGGKVGETGYSEGGLVEENEPDPTEKKPDAGTLHLMFAKAVGGSK